jgi:enamine deaminase RidA (YjgF/YER057c/UK114 family)
MNKAEISEKLNGLGITLGAPPKPGGSYVAVNVRQNTAFVAIQFPIQDDKFFFQGRLGEEVSTEQGYEAARMSAANILKQINLHVGFERIVGLNHIDVYYQAGDNWDDGPKVANGASDLFLLALGERGQHTRAIMGVHKLPRSHSVAIVASFSVKE